MLNTIKTVPPKCEVIVRNITNEKLDFDGSFLKKDGSPFLRNLIVLLIC